MKTQAVFLAALAAAPSALAHTVWSVFYVDGVSQGDGAAIRMRKDPKYASFPLEDFSSNDMACNVDGEKGVNFVSPVQDGSTLTFEMRSWPNDPSKESLDRGHYGPCAVYLKKVSSAIKDPGAGDGWFKLMDDGYHKETDQWCTDRLIDNNGRLSVELPKGLEGGYYLARPEVVALHNATEGGAQFYTSCAQIFIDSTGNLVPDSTVAIPGPDYVTAGQSSVKFNIYVGKNAEYQPPGPAVANFTSNTNAASTAQTKQTEGLVPDSCIAQNGNWCGKEVASYSDEAGCWAAGQDCWAQNEDCFDNAGPTGNKVCLLWSDKCTALNDACSAKDFNGPPNKGQVITPKRQTIDIGLVIKPSGGGTVESSAPKSSAAPKTSAAPTSSTVPKSSAVPDAQPSSLAPKPSFAESSPAYITSSPSPASLTDSFIETPSFASSESLLSFSQGLYVLPSISDTSTPAAKPTATATSTITVPASEYPTEAPAPTAAGACPEGYECVTEYKVHVVTEVKYVTVVA